MPFRLSASPQDNRNAHDQANFNDKLDCAALLRDRMEG